MSHVQQRWMDESVEKKPQGYPDIGPTYNPSVGPQKETFIKDRSSFGHISRITMYLMLSHKTIQAQVSHIIRTLIHVN